MSNLKPLDHDKQNIAYLETIRIKELEVENARLRAALGKYANKDYWAQTHGSVGAFDWFLLGNAGWDIADDALRQATKE